MHKRVPYIGRRIAFVPVAVTSFRVSLRMKGASAALFLGDGRARVKCHAFLGQSEGAVFRFVVKSDWRRRVRRHLPIVPIFVKFPSSPDGKFPSFVCDRGCLFLALCA